MISDRANDYLGAYMSPNQAILNNNNFFRWIPDYQLTLTSVKNTEITCRNCRGRKFVYTTSDNIKLRFQVCPLCEGTGKMKTWDDRVSTR